MSLKFQSSNRKEKRRKKDGTSASGMSRYKLVIVGDGACGKTRYKVGKGLWPIKLWLKVGLKMMEFKGFRSNLKFNQIGLSNLIYKSQKIQIRTKSSQLFENRPFWRQSNKVCHGFSLTKQDDCLQVTFDHF